MKKRIELNPFVLFLLSCVVFIFVSIVFFLLGKFFIYTDLPANALENEAKYTIVLDAGHGGIDGGASANGVFEKDLNLALTKKIKEFLLLYNVDVQLTREKDTLLADPSSQHKKRDDLFNRLKFAKSFNKTVFVSIHMNKFPEEKYKGLQVFYSKNDPFSEALALLVQENTKELLQPYNNRKVKAATSSIYLLDRLETPAVLIECGFLSNTEDLKDLTNENYQNKLAFVIANSIIEFINF